jgi:hypothetical protein
VITPVDAVKEVLPKGHNACLDQLRHRGGLVQVSDQSADLVGFGCLQLLEDGPPETR